MSLRQAQPSESFTWKTISRPTPWDDSRGDSATRLSCPITGKNSTEKALPAWRPIWLARSLH